MLQIDRLNLRDLVLETIDWGSKALFHGQTLSLLYNAIVIRYPLNMGFVCLEGGHIQMSSQVVVFRHKYQGRSLSKTNLPIDTHDRCIREFDL
jgi:hypothetical protein